MSIEYCTNLFCSALNYSKVDSRIKMDSGELFLYSILSSTDSLSNPKLLF